eukprot:COSAG01_NODE_8101_length_2921_cov_70.806166_2_plen_58_part_00
MKQVYGLIFGNLARALRRSNLHGATAVGGRDCLVRGRGDWDLSTDNRPAQLTIAPLN